MGPRRPRRAHADSSNATAAGHWAIRARRALLPAALAALWLVAAGCGYRQDVPRLPAGALSLAIGPIENATFTGELDVRLRDALKRRLMRHAHITLRPPEASDLVLTVRLTGFDITRTLDPAVTANRTFGFRLEGRYTVQDRRRGEPLVSGRPLRVRVALVQDPGTLETPAIRDEGIDDAVDAFAERLLEEVLLVF